VISSTRKEEGEGMDKILLCLVGLPRSGKSTWAKDMEYRNEFYPVVNKDAIRLALHGRRYDQSREGHVHQACKLMITSLFLAGHKIVCLDETNTTEIRRNTCMSREWKVRFKVFATPKEECIRRAMTVGDIDIVPIIEKMSAQWEPLTEEEQTRIWKG
jgi:predicted kinase